MKILYVAMPFSIHTARWMSQLNEQKWDKHLFPSMAFQPLHSSIKNITYHESFYNIIHPQLPDNKYSSVYLNWLPPIQNKNIKRAFRFFATAFRIEKTAAEKLAQVIQKIKPDIIHSLETQHAGYLVKESKKYVKGNFPKWVHSNWGIDIHFFGQLQAHTNLIRETLNGIDVLIVEGGRDKQLATEFGFNKEFYTFPVGGGYHIPTTPVLPVNQRSKILIKGMQDEVRRGLVAMRAVERCVDLMDRYEIVLYSSNEVTRAAAELFYHRTGKKITVIEQISHEEMTKLNSQARINLCVNASDGLPNAMLEAMLMGAFPIQSETSLASEWITNGRNGFLVPSDDPDKIENVIRKVLSDDDLCEKAGEYNRKLISERLEYKSIKNAVVNMYEKILSAK